MEEQPGRLGPQGPQPLQPIRVVMPAEVAYDLGNLHQAIDKLAERLGHPTCMSGRSCVLDQEREFLIDAQTFEARGLSEGRS